MTAKTVVAAVTVVETLGAVVLVGRPAVAPVVVVLADTPVVGGADVPGVPTFPCEEHPTASSAATRRNAAAGHGAVRRHILSLLAVVLPP